MSILPRKEIQKFVEQQIPEFHRKRLERLQTLKLNDVLKRKNPYLFRAKNVQTSGEFVELLLIAHLSSQEETIFGDFLEKLAIFSCSLCYGGQKSSSEGIDLDFQRDGVRYIVSIKSGPNWANSRQIAKMKDDFRKAKRILGTNRNSANVIAVNGCCYGRENQENKGDYLKVCGQSFWTLITGQISFYTDIIEPLGHQAKVGNDEFQKQFSNVVNLFTADFIQQFCSKNGAIDWVKLVEFNSAKVLKK